MLRSSDRFEAIRPGTPLTKEDARQLIEKYVDHYNTVRLHSAIGFVTPADMLAGRQAQIHTARDRKLEAARQQRQIRRQQAATAKRDTLNLPGETEAIAYLHKSAYLGFGPVGGTTVFVHSKGEAVSL